MMNPRIIRQNELMDGFTEENTWHFVPFSEAQVCNLL